MFFDTAFLAAIQRATNGDAPCKSQSMYKVSSLRRPQCTERQSIYDRGSLPFANALAARCQTYMGA